MKPERGGWGVTEKKQPTMYVVSRGLRLGASRTVVMVTADAQYAASMVSNNDGVDGQDWEWQQASYVVAPDPRLDSDRNIVACIGNPQSDAETKVASAIDALRVVARVVSKLGDQVDVLMSNARRGGA